MLYFFRLFTFIEIVIGMMTAMSPTFVEVTIFI